MDSMAKTHTKGGEGIGGGCIPSYAKNESPLLKLNSFKRNTKLSQLKHFMKTSGVAVLHTISLL